MININNKSWDKLSFSDIETFLIDGEENTFFEFKEDRESNEKLTKEIVAFSNTYGGYVLLGVNNDKSISGCSAWNEQRIHTLIHDSVLPTPIIDVKKLTREDGITIYVIKVEEGPLPPYVTNNGQIYERLSSGAFPIKDSGRLTLFYNKRNDAINNIRNKIEIPDLTITDQFPENFCGYFDMGFSLTCSGPTVLQKHFYNYDFSQVVDQISNHGFNPFSISQVGGAYQISLGKVSVTNGKGKELLIDAGMNNYIEIIRDGSIRSRFTLCSNVGTAVVPIYRLGIFNSIFRKVYQIIFEKDLLENFIYAQKYERLTVLKQFCPAFGVYEDENNGDKDILQPMSDTHNEKYGNNLVVIGNRNPWNGYNIIDKRSICQKGEPFSVDALLDELFKIRYSTLGFIDLSPINTISINKENKDKSVEEIWKDNG